MLKKATDAMELILKASNAPADLFALYQLYIAAGDRVNGRRCLQQLLEKDPSNALYLTAGLEELVEDRNFAAAQTFAGKLAQLRVTDFKSLAAIARFEAKAGRPERGLAVAEDYARLADAGVRRLPDPLCAGGRTARRIEPPAGRARDARRAEDHHRRRRPVRGHRADPPGGGGRAGRGARRRRPRGRRVRAGRAPQPPPPGPPAG